MEQQSDNIQTYRNVRVSTAHPSKIVVMMYDELMKQIVWSIDNLKKGAGAYDTVHNGLSKAKSIVTELSASLNMSVGGKFSEEMFRLYDYFNAQLSKANLNKDAAPLEKIRPLVEELRDSWKSAHDSADTGASSATGSAVSAATAAERLATDRAGGDATGTAVPPHSSVDING